MVTISSVYWEEKGKKPKETTENAVHLILLTNHESMNKYFIKL